MRKIEKCRICGHSRYWHCSFDEPGVDHVITCLKHHHTFKKKLVEAQMRKPK